MDTANTNFAITRTALDAAVNLIPEIRGLGEARIKSWLLQELQRTTLVPRSDIDPLQLRADSSALRFEAPNDGVVAIVAPSEYRDDTYAAITMRPLARLLRVKGPRRARDMRALITEFTSEEVEQLRAILSKPTVPPSLADVIAELESIAADIGEPSASAIKNAVFAAIEGLRIAPSTEPYVVAALSIGVAVAREEVERIRALPPRDDVAEFEDEPTSEYADGAPEALWRASWLREDAPAEDVVAAPDSAVEAPFAPEKALTNPGVLLLRQRFEALGWNQKTLAAAIKVSAPDLSRYLRGIRIPGAKIAGRIQEALGIPASAWTEGA